MRKNSGYVFFLIVLLICGGGGFYYYSTLVKERDRRQENLSACLDNLRVITKAAEESNVERKKMNRRLISHPDTLDLNALVAEKLLKRVPVCPDGGKYLIHGSFGQSDGSMGCSFHVTATGTMKIKLF